MTLWIRRRLAHEDGISLVEMMIAIFIIALVLMALASTTITSYASIRANESRTRATALANEALENMRVLPWDELVFYSADSPAPPPGQVTVTGSRPAGSRAPLHREQVARDGRTYTLTRFITWFDDPATSNTNTPGQFDYKELRVEVSWMDGTVARDLAVETLRAPTPDEKAGSDFVLSAVDAQPSIVYTDATGIIVAPPVNAIYPTGAYPVTPVAMSARTSRRADSVSVGFTRTDSLGNPNAVLVYLAGSDGNTWWVGQTDPDPFPNGDVVFTFEAVRTANGSTVSVTSTRIVRFLRPLVVATTLSPSSVCTEYGATPVYPDILVTMDIQGSLKEDVVTVTWPGGTGEASYVAHDSAGATFEFRIPAASYSGSMDVNVTVERLTDLATASGTASFTAYQAAENEICGTTQ